MRHNELLDALQNLTGRKPRQRDFAEVLNLPINTIGTRAKRNSNYSVEEIKKINQAFGVDLFQQKVLNEYINTLANDYTSQKISEFNAGQDDIVADYFYNAFGSCGSGAFVLSEDKEQIRVPKVIIEYFSPCKKYSVINAIGDSMMPYICDKDKLIVEHCEPFEQIKDNKVYVFCYNNEIFVKRLVKNIDEIIVKSDNPDPIYRVRYIEKEDMNNIFLIGQIVGLMRNTR